MSEQLTLSADARERAGKGASRELRNQGRVPAVVYGDKQDPLSIHIEEKALVKVLNTGHFMNSVVMIDVAGRSTRTLPKDVQFHPVTDRPLHVDFLRISEHATVTVAVPIRFVGEENSPGLKRGGVLNTVRHELELTCDASEMADEVVIDLAASTLAIRSISAMSRFPRAAVRRSPTAISPLRRSSLRPVEVRGRRRRSRSGRWRCRRVSAGRRRPGRQRRRLIRLLRWLGYLFGARRAEVPGQPATAEASVDWGEFEPVQIWVGLGNPGAQYAMHRHNVGYMAADAIAEIHDFDPPKKGFAGWVRQGRIADKRILILKPATFMNESGRSVASDAFFQERLATSPSFTTNRSAPFRSR